MVKVAVSVLLGVGIGVGCRVFDIPVPSPPSIVGVLLIFSITAGYLAADRMLGRKAGTPPSAESR